MQAQKNSFNTEIFRSLRLVAVNALTGAGVPEGVIHKENGFLIVPRANGCAIGVYYTVSERMSMEEYKNVRGERLSFCRHILKRTGFAVSPIPPALVGGEQGLEAVLR